MKVNLRKRPGGVCAARGFLAGAVSCGIKPGGKKRDDFALVASDVPAIAAATFTTNRVKAAPVRISMEHLRSATARAVVLNSGNANACTGEKGIEHSRRTASAIAEVLDVDPRQILVCSTGRIGIPLPIEKMEKAAPALVGVLNRKGSDAAAPGHHDKRYRAQGGRVFGFRQWSHILCRRNRQGRGND